MPAGMERISIDLGQFVVTGEPVAVMGGGAQLPKRAVQTNPYFKEFRKDGVPVDPGPWWARRPEGSRMIAHSLSHRPSEKKRIADPTKGCNYHRRIVAVCRPELGEFIQ